MTRLIDLYSEGRAALVQRDEEIRTLRTELGAANKQLTGLQLPPSLGAEIQLQHPAVKGARMGLIQATGVAEPTPWIEVIWAPEGDSLPWTPDDVERVEAWLRVRLGNPATEVTHQGLQMEGAAG